MWTGRYARCSRLPKWKAHTRIVSGIRLQRTLLGRGASFEEVADILGNSPEVVRKHYGKWSSARQSRIDDLMNRVFISAEKKPREKARVQLIR